MSSMDELIEQYLDPRNPGSFGGVDRLYRAVKDDVDNKDEVIRALQHVNAYTVNKETRRRFKRNRIIVTNLRQQFQIDLADMSKYRDQNDGINFPLVAIDCFSRKCSVHPLFNKSGLKVQRALEKVVIDLGQPDKIQSDKGTEFWNAPVRAFLKKNQIKLFTSENDDIKCSMVERLIRTLKSRMWRYFHHVGHTRYIDKLQDFVHSYNNSTHKAHQREPDAVTQDNSLEVFNTLYGSMLSEPTKNRFR